MGEVEGSIIQKSQTTKPFWFHTVELGIQRSLTILFQLIRKETIQCQEGRFSLALLQKGFLISGRWSCLPGDTTRKDAMGEEVSEPQMVRGARNEHRPRFSQSVSSVMASNLRSCCCLKRKPIGNS